MTPSTFSSAHARAQAAKIALLIGVVINFIEIIGGGVSQLFPEVTGDEEFGDNPGGMVVILLRLGLLLLSIGVYITTVVLFLMWLHRSLSNVQAFGYNQRDHSPAWAVGSFFIPFVNLVVPFKATREAWEKSVPPDDNFFSVPSPPATFAAWWTFWLACCIAGNIAFRVERSAAISQVGIEILGAITELLTVIAGIFAFLVIREIDQRQTSTSQRLNLGGYAVPPPPTQFDPSGTI
jgi:Domain of unknown function (DUF4328)